MNRSYHVAVLGASGLVGKEFVRLLQERNFPVQRLTLLDNAHGAGGFVEFGEQELVIQEVKAEHFRGVDIALFSPNASASQTWVPVATDAGALVIDNSSAFCMENDVPLVVPEVNAEAIDLCQKRKIVSSPNGSTIQLALVLKPLHDAANILRIVVSTYQSVSGKGQRGIDELERQISDLMNARETESKAFAHRIAFNVLPHIDAFTENGYTKEEMKIVHETRKIMGSPDLRVSATAVRVPLFFGHSESVNITTEKKLTAAQARELLTKAPGLKVLDEPASNVYPMPMLAVGDSDVHVGRIREDFGQANGLDLFISGDNLRKGASLNTVQIAELLLQRNLV